MSPRGRIATAVGVCTAVAAVARRGTRGMDVRDLTGRRAVVTGAGSGIGRSLAQLLASRGATVHVVDRDVERARAVADEIGPRGIAHAVDVADADAVRSLAEQVHRQGPVDLLFNNAGIAMSGDVADTPLDDWRQLLSINLMGVVHGIHAFLPRMLAEGRPAAIVNTSSMAGLMPSASGVPYSTSKAGVLALSVALDQEVRPSGVQVHALCPGIVATDILRAGVARGEFAAKIDALDRLYEALGSSPDVIARQALDAVARRKTIIPSPRFQVLPPWLLIRIAPQLGTQVWSMIVRGLTNRALEGYGYVPPDEPPVMSM